VFAYFYIGLKIALKKSGKYFEIVLVGEEKVIFWLIYKSLISSIYFFSLTDNSSLAKPRAIFAFR